MKKYEVTIFAEGGVEYIVRVMADSFDDSYDKAEERFKELFPDEAPKIEKRKSDLLDMPD